MCKPIKILLCKLLHMDGFSYVFNFIQETENGFEAGKHWYLEVPWYFEAGKHWMGSVMICMDMNTRGIRCNYYYYFSVQKELNNWPGRNKDGIQKTRYFAFNSVEIFVALFSQITSPFWDQFPASILNLAKMCLLLSENASLPLWMGQIFSSLSDYTVFLNELIFPFVGVPKWRTFLFSYLLKWSVKQSLVSDK